MKKRKKIRTIFLGTPDFGVSCLEALVSSDFFEVIGVISQPDKPVGRQQKITSPTIKIIAEKHRLPVYQPEKIKTEVALIEKLNPELIVVVAYGQIIPESILQIPKYGCINVHGSLLPRYRGAACLQAAILNGDHQSGVTIMQMDKGLDTGPILAQKKIKLDRQETLESLHDKLVIVGAKLLLPTLKKYVQGKITPQPQKEDEASYIKMIQKEDGRIDWSDTAKNIERKIRAFNPWPGTFSCLSDKNLGLKDIIFKIKAVRPEPIRSNKYQIGETFRYKNALAIQCGQNSLVVIKLQLEGKKAMETDEFLRGHETIIGSILH